MAPVGEDLPGDTHFLGLTAIITVGFQLLFFFVAYAYKFDKVRLRSPPRLAKGVIAHRSSSAPAFPPRTHRSPISLAAPTLSSSPS
jgi:hypothetical protein